MGPGAPAAPAAGWAADVLGFWFGDLTPEDWYRHDPALDARVRGRFLRLHETLAAGVPPEARTDAETALAAVIALDQFPRNMFRGTARAFATDPQALALARHAVDAGLAAGLPPARRQFLFLPFMHAEDLPAQERAVALFEAVPELAENVPFAVEHRDIVRRFGRFPHRNRALGRASTPAEEVFLAEYAGFGQ